MSERILVVDDQDSMLHSVDRVLRGAYQVCCCRSAAEALEQAGDFALALLDVRMPDMSGFELMDRLQQRKPAPDVIFMTGNINEHDRQLVRAVDAGAFYFIQKPFDRKVLLALVSRCLERRRLMAQLGGEKQRLVDELAKARVFQHSMLPATKWQRDGLHINALYVPCAELCGDLYDYEADEAGRTAVLVADVSGHGVSAAMLTGIVKSAFHAALGEGHSPGMVMRRIAAAMRAFDPAMFVTGMCLRISAKSRQLEYANAGHPAGWLWSAEREPVALPDTGPMISPAWPDDGLWDTRIMPLTPGDHVLMYTDGLETVAQGKAILGAQNVMGVVKESKAVGQALLARLLERAREFGGGSPFEDDISMVTISMTA